MKGNREPYKPFYDEKISNITEYMILQFIKYYPIYHHEYLF